MQSHDISSSHSYDMYDECAGVQITPMLNAEMAPPHRRGSMNVLFQVRGASCLELLARQVPCRNVQQLVADVSRHKQALAQRMQRALQAWACAGKWGFQMLLTWYAHAAVHYDWHLGCWLHQLWNQLHPSLGLEAVSGAGRWVQCF